MRSYSRRTTLALDAVRAAIAVLEKVQATEERDRLLEEAHTFERKVVAWAANPPNAAEREELMRKVLALNVAVARLRRA